MTGLALQIPPPPEGEKKKKSLVWFLIVPVIPTFVQRESDGRRSLWDSPNLGQPTGKDEAIIP